MNKEKLDQIKQKIKSYAPTVIAFTAAAGAAMLIANSIKTSSEAPVETDDGMFPEVTGEEKEKLLAREDALLSQIDDLNYILFVPKTNTED